MNEPTFTETLADLLAEYFPGSHMDHDAAAALLSSADMRAVGRALLGMATSLAEGCNDDINHGDADGRFTLLESRSTLAEYWLAEWGLPDHVIRWVITE